MEKAIMMQVASLDGPVFNATKWFTSGMYKRRKEVIMGKERDSNVSMLRVSPPPFTDKQNEDIVSWAAYTLEERSFPEDARAKSDRDYLYETEPELRHRMVYKASGFDAPDKPVDLYELYLTTGKKRYLIDFSRDGVSGKILNTGNAYLVKNDDEKMAQFNEFEEQERKQKR